MNAKKENPDLNWFGRSWKNHPCIAIYPTKEIFAPNLEELRLVVQRIYCVDMELPETLKYYGKEYPFTVSTEERSELAVLLAQEQLSRMEGGAA